MRITTLEQYEAAYQKSIEQPEAFWGDIAEQFTWYKKWDKVLEWNFTEPNVKWFVGGKTNITENCLDRHLPTRGNKIAIIWEPNDPKERQLPYLPRAARPCMSNGKCAKKQRHWQRRPRLPIHAHDTRTSH